MLVPRPRDGDRRLSGIGNQAGDLVEVDIREDSHYHLLTGRAESPRSTERRIARQ
jgi:hypothetical protein